MRTCGMFCSRYDQRYLQAAGYVNQTSGELKFPMPANFI